MPVCSCCPNFISPGVARCENCNSPAGELFDCPVCGNDVLKGETYCHRCRSFISKDGTRGGDTAWEVSDDREFDNDVEDPDEFEDDRSDEDDEVY
jgi:hypothetical protein